MKRLFSLILSVAMILTMSVNVFAYESVYNDQGEHVATQTYQIRNSSSNSGKYYYYNTDTGVVTESTDKTLTDKGKLVTLPATEANYAFTYKDSSGNTHRYRLLDEEVGADGKKQYFIYSDNIYGNIASLMTGKTNNFNLDDTTGIGYFLNNDFLNESGTSTSTVVFPDEVMKDYIQEHNYRIEGTYNIIYTGQYEESLGKYAYQKYDYTENMKISLLSITEYAKYSEKIAYNVYKDNSLYNTHKPVFFRSPATDQPSAITKLRYHGPHNGNTATAALTGESYIRPCFWVSEDYFKNVPLTSAGTEVQKVVDSLFPNNKFTITDNADGGKLSPLWTSNVGASVTEDGQISIPKGKKITRALPKGASTGTLTMEADFDEVGNGAYFALVLGNATDSGNNIPLYLKLSAKELGSGDDTWKRVAYRQNGGDTPYRRLDGGSSSAPSYNTPVNAKISIDLDTGVAYAVIKSKINDTDTVWYAKTETAKPLNYVKDSVTSENAVTKVSIGHAGTNVYDDAVVVLDNLKVTYDPTGSVIDTITQLSAYTLKLDFKDGINISAVTANDIVITDSEVADIVKVGNSIYATLKDPIADNNSVVTNVGYFAIVNNLKYADGTEVIGNSASFEYNSTTAEPFATFINETYTKGETVQAYAAIPNASGKSGTMSVIVAAYSGNELVCAEVERIENVTADSATAVAEDVSLTLTDNADTIKVFLWDGNLSNLAYEAAVATE